MGEDLCDELGEFLLAASSGFSDSAVLDAVVAEGCGGGAWGDPVTMGL